MNIENSKLARSLFRFVLFFICNRIINLKISKTSKLEQELASLLKRKSPVDRSITQLRNQYVFNCYNFTLIIAFRIRDNYEQVLFLDLVFAQTKDIDQLLWKCVFYKAIEEFRKIIQKVCYTIILKIFLQLLVPKITNTRKRTRNKRKTCKSNSIFPLILGRCKQVL